MTYCNNVLEQRNYVFYGSDLWTLPCSMWPPFKKVLSELLSWRWCAKLKSVFLSSCRHVTRNMMMPVWSRSKLCTTPCKCQLCTTNMRKRATSGYRNSSRVTLKTFPTQSSSTLLRKYTRGTSERTNSVRCMSLGPFWVCPWRSD